MTRPAICIALLVVSTVAASPGQAAPCAGFFDVDDTSQFCPNVEWMKNRQITLGCGTGGYCPNDPVTRLSMSAFLQRLGVALLPRTLGETIHPGGVNVTLANTPVVCAGGLYVLAPTSFPRTARGHATFSFRSAGVADVAVEIVESTNSGATWTAASPPMAATAADQQWATVAVLLPPRPLAVNVTYEYGLRISRRAGSATAGNPSEYKCGYKLYADNRNPATPPLDE